MELCAQIVRRSGHNRRPANDGCAGRQAALQEVLAEKMGEDPDFAEVVRRLVEEARAADTRNVIAFGERSVAVAAM